METCNHSHQGGEEEDQSTIIVSGEEARDDHESEDLLGVGRPHECVYCKRGFNSAQALGGHMNIHRKDGAKINKPSHEEHMSGSSIYYQNLSPQSHEKHHHHQLGMINCGMYLPPESKSLTSSCCNDFQPPVDSKRTSLSLESPSMIVKDLKRSDKPAIDSRDELDLELRLGYDS